MSERRREQQPPESLIGNGNDFSQRPHHQPPPSPAAAQPYAPRTIAGPPNAQSPALTRYPSGHGRSIELPSLQQALPASVASYQPAPRSVGVSSILNPVDAEESPQSRRRKASELDTAANVLPPLGLHNNRPSQSATSTPTPTSMNFGGGYGAERAPRRILTPRSPSVHRAASLSQLSTSVAPSSASFALSPRSRTYTIEPGTGGAPPLPRLPPAARHSSHTFSAPTPPPPAQAVRRLSTGASARPRPASESASPRSSYSSYNEASPAGTYGQSSMPTLSASYSAKQDYGNHNAGGSHAEQQRSVGVPISSSGGQNVYQMMTLETTSGTVSLPVDVQAASRVADEKRRRNAGASARFRQRRKEKEKEASTTISRLEQQLKELSEDMEFYKRERDYMAGVILQVPGGDRHFPRPQSPRHRRTSGYSGHGGAGGYMPYEDAGARSPETGRNVRRRTSTLSLPHYASQTQNPHGSSGSTMAQSYPPPHYGQQIAPPQHLQQSQQQAAGPLPSPLERGNLPPPLMQATPQTGPWNPYSDRRGPQQTQPGAQQPQHAQQQPPPSSHHRSNQHRESR